MTDSWVLRTARHLFLAAVVVVAAMGMSARQLSELTAAGVGAGVIEALMAEKSLETASFTVAEITSLKKAGMSDDTIIMLVHERSFMKNTGTTVYGQDIKPLNAANIDDLVTLKEKGMSDEVLQELIRYQSTRSSDDDRRQAWEMLKGMGVVIDGR